MSHVRRVMFRSGLLLLASVSALHAAPVFQMIREFVRTPVGPQGGLLLASDGNYYGVSHGGGANGMGSLFRLDSSGTMTVLASFDGWAGTNGASPNGSLIEGADGALYGLCDYLSETSSGVFRYSAATGLQSFASFPASGDLVRDAEGNFYGKSQGGGTYGSLFKITPAGEAIVLYSFEAFQVPDLRSGLTPGPGGAFYGTCRSSSPGQPQVLFRLGTDGSFTEVADISTALGGTVFINTLTLGADGNFYGITGIYEAGSFVRITPSGVVTIIGSATAIGQGKVPTLTLGPDGNFYGSTSGESYPWYSDGGSLFRITPQGVVTSLHQFSTTDGRGWGPGPLTVGPDGELHGVTTYLQGIPSGSGSSSDMSYTPTAFKISTSGVYTFLRSFGTDTPAGIFGNLVPDKAGGFIADFSWGGDHGRGGLVRLQPDGATSFIVSYDQTTGSGSGGVVVGRDGNYYGATWTSYYRLTPEGRFTVLADLSSVSANPYYPLQIGKDGNFYTFGAYSSSPDVVVDPVILKFTPRGAVSVLTNFGHSDTETVGGDLAQGRDGSFYIPGYPASADPSRILKIKRTGAVSTFATLPLPQKPWGPLTPGANGSFYGFSSPDEGITGALYKIDSGGRVSILANPLPDHMGPGGRMLLAADGFYYGLSYSTVSPHVGVVFRMSAAGDITLLHSFPNNSYSIDNGLVQGPDGHIYGSTQTGGTKGPFPYYNQGGSFFRLYLGAAFETAPATNITWNGATLHATVDPAGGTTTVSFQYSTEPTFKRPLTVRAGKLAADAAPTDVSATARLQPGRTYWFRAVTTSSENSKLQTGDVLSFTTPPRPSRVVRYGADAW